MYKNLNGANPTVQAILNFLEPVSRGGITPVEEKRLQEIARVHQLRSGECNQRLDLGDSHGVAG
jgi:hypothetical protein